METKAKHEVKELLWPKKNFLAKRAKVNFDDLSDFFNKSYPLLYSAIINAKLVTTNSPCAIYYTVDEKIKVTEVAAAAQIDGPLKDLKGFENITLSESKVLCVNYYGPYEDTGAAYAEMDKYLKDHNLKRVLLIEEYVTDPTTEKDPGKLETNLYYIVKPL